MCIFLPHDLFGSLCLAISYWWQGIAWQSHKSQNCDADVFCAVHENDPPRWNWPHTVLWGLSILSMFQKCCSVNICIHNHYNKFTFVLFQLKWDSCEYFLLILFLCFQVAYVTTFLPCLLLFILMIRALSLPGSFQGAKYFLYPDSSKLLDKNVCWMGKIYFT